MAKIKEIILGLMSTLGKLSQYELSENTGISQSMISRIVCGDAKNINKTALKKLSDFFEITPEQLLGNEPIEKIKIFTEEETQKSTAEILHILMEKEGISELELSKKTLVNQSTINRIINGNTLNPQGSSLRKIAKYFDISLSQLTGKEPLNFNDINVHKNLQNKNFIKKVPIVKFNNIKNIENILSNIKLTDTFEGILVEYNNPESYFATAVPDDSMRPFFDRDSILVLNFLMEPKDGDYAMVEINNNELLFGEISISDGSYYIQTHNPINIKKLENPYRFLGVVIESRRSLRV